MNLNTLISEMRDRAAQGGRLHETQQSAILLNVAAEQLEFFRLLVTEAAKHINNTTGAASRPESDSGVLYIRMMSALDADISI